LLGNSEEVRDHSETIDVHETDHKMNVAIKNAIQTFPEFLDRYTNRKETDTEFSVKVMIEDQYGVEHFWVSDIEIKEDMFVGYIANEPQQVKSVVLGQKVNFQKQIISDWAYNDNGIRQGSFTLKVLLNRMPKGQADYYKRIIGW
jgi:uncharacterized protein YegJ (DUF2314 family)